MTSSSSTNRNISPTWPGCHLPLPTCRGLYGGRVAETSLRRANPSDAAAIGRLAELAYEKYVGRIGRRPAPMDTDYAGLIGRANVWVLMYDTELVGSLVTCVADGHLLLDAVAVAPHAQGRGYGALLLRRAEDDARD